MMNERQRTQRVEPSDAPGSGDERSAMIDELSADPLPHRAPAKVLPGSAGALPIAGLGWLELGS